MKRTWHVMELYANSVGIARHGTLAGAENHSILKRVFVQDTPKLFEQYPRGRSHHDIVQHAFCCLKHFQALQSVYENNPARKSEPDGVWLFFGLGRARLVLVALHLLLVPWHRSQLFLLINLGHRSNLIGCRGGLVGCRISGHYELVWIGHRTYQIHITFCSRDHVGAATPRTTVRRVGGGDAASSAVKFGQVVNGYAVGIPRAYPR